MKFGTDGFRLVWGNRGENIVSFMPKQDGADFEILFQSNNTLWGSDIGKIAGIKIANNSIQMKFGESATEDWHRVYRDSNGFLKAN